MTNKRLKTLLKKAEEVTSASHHPCHAPNPIDDRTLDAPLFPPINQWGQLPYPLEDHYYAQTRAQQTAVLSTT